MAHRVTWFHDTRDGVTVIQVNTDGNFVADLFIKLTGLHVLSAESFLL